MVFIMEAVSFKCFFVVTMFRCVFLFYNVAKLELFWFKSGSVSLVHCLNQEDLIIGDHYGVLCLHFGQT